MSLALAKAQKPTKRQTRKRKKKLGVPSYEDEYIRNSEGVLVSVHGKDKGTPELNEKGQANEVLIYHEGDNVGRKRTRSYVRRTSDILDQMRRSGLLSSEEARAGRKFRTDFEIGGFQELRCSGLDWMPPGDRAEAKDKQIEAANRAWAALRALGGPNSINGQCAWWVLGAGMNATEWGEKKIFGGGRSIPRQHASGIIMATCGLLARHYGYTK